MEGGEIYMLMNRKGFTLVELLMVVIIIGILVTLAVPNYYKSIERAKGGKAKGAMDVIKKASIQYRALEDIYPAGLDDMLDCEIPAGMAAAATFDDGDWVYSLAANTATTLDIVATRNAGEHTGDTLTMDQDGDVVNSAAGNEWD